MTITKEINYEEDKKIIDDGFALEFGSVDLNYSSLYPLVIKNRSVIKIKCFIKFRSVIKI